MVAMIGKGEGCVSAEMTKEGMLASLGRVEAALKLRYMGIGFVWAWLYCTYATSAVFPHRQGQSINADESWLLSAVAVVLTFFIAGAVLGRRDGERVPWRTPVAAALLLAIGTVVSALGDVRVAFAWVGGAMTGVGYALLSVLWAQALMALDIDELEVAVPISATVTIPCVVVFPLLEGAPGIAATALLPLISGMLLLLCLRDGKIRQSSDSILPEGGDADPVRSHPSDSPKRSLGVEGQWVGYLVRVAIVLVALYVAVGWQAALADVQDGLHTLIGLDVAMLLSSLASVALGIAIVFFSRKVSFSMLFRWAIPCVIMTLALKEVPLPWMEFASNAIGDTLDSLIQVLVYLFAITLAKQGKAPVALCVGILEGAVQLGVLMGNLLGSASAATDLMWSAGTTGSLLICLVALASILAPLREPVEERPGLADPDAIESSLLRGCQCLQARFGLTDRETEIAFLLARGRSRPYIREKLFISKNTVATHIRHIYGKLGVHSKEELIDLATDAAKECR